MYYLVGSSATYLCQVTIINNCQPFIWLTKGIFIPAHYAQLGLENSMFYCASFREPTLGFSVWYWNNTESTFLLQSFVSTNNFISDSPVHRAAVWISGCQVSDHSVNRLDMDNFCLAGIRLGRVSVQKQPDMFWKRQTVIKLMVIYLGIILLDLYGLLLSQHI